MKYVSSRGKAPILDFEDVLLAGLALDGGLYLPERWPHFSPDDIAGLLGLPYAEAAHRIMAPFVAGSAIADDLPEILAEAYASFSHRAVVPLSQLGPENWLLELFHGPTLAFKDVAMQVLSRLMDRVLAARGQRATIVGATSGDTGGAAIEAFRGREAIDIFILFPHGRVSDVQRRQMTTAPEANVHAIAIDGTFDDCQALVKALFNDHELRARLSLAGVNSINWARILAQIPYYFVAAVALGAPHRPVRFTVPTGNFGDIFAGYAAYRMGLPVDRLVIATNVNDILARTLETGRYEPQGVQATASPSMDIQVSSNFERLLFELSDRDAARVRDLMDHFAQKGQFTLQDTEMAALRHLFSAHRIDEAETRAIIRQVHEQTGLIVDPHTAVGVGAAQKEIAQNGPLPLMITLATAHPAKFPQVVGEVLGIAPPTPESVRRQATLSERFDRLPNDYTQLAGYIEARARAR